CWHEAHPIGHIGDAAQQTTTVEGGPRGGGHRSIVERTLYAGCWLRRGRRGRLQPGQRSERCQSASQDAGRGSGYYPGIMEWRTIQLSRALFSGAPTFHCPSANQMRRSEIVRRTRLLTLHSASLTIFVLLFRFQSLSIHCFTPSR